MTAVVSDSSRTYQLSVLVHQVDCLLLLLSASTPAILVCRLDRDGDTAGKVGSSRFVR